MNKSKVVAMIAFSAIFVAVGFQNCAKVGVSDLQGQGQSKPVGDGIALPNGDEDGTATIGQPTDDGTMTPPVVVADDAQPPKQEMPPTTTQTPPKDREPADDDVAQMPPTAPTVPTEQPKTPPVVVAEQPPTATPPKADEPKAPDVPVTTTPTPTADLPIVKCDPAKDDCESDAVALCMSSKSVKMNQIVGSNVGKNGQPLVVKSNSLQLVAKSGNVVVIADGANSKVEVTGFHGKLTLCGMSGGHVTGSGGKLILIQSKLDSVIGHQNVRPDGSSEIVDSTGSHIKPLN